MAKELIGVTGVTGAVGGRVARRLADAGATQRLIVRDRSTAPDLGAEVAEASDYGDFDSFRSAVQGIDTLFLVSGREHAERLRQHLTAVDAAVAAGVSRIVYLSALRAAEDATFTLARQHYATEQHIRATGLPFTFVRNSLYLDFIPWLATAEGVIAGPAGRGRLAPVSRDDIADVAAAVLVTREHDGQALELTGPETWDFYEIAAELSRVSGRTVTYKDETLEEAWASRRPSGHPDWEIEGWVTSYLAIKNGEADLVTDAVPRVTGHPAQSLPDYLAKNPESYRHLLPG
ncbi:MAG TPA: SDR family oxidoreductase [Actinomycetota bacterium]|nr:SDR family oxidoreductase [Actinomycetota bacterium]